jgi:phytoene dehydrogenase-like protein
MAVRDLVDEWFDSDALRAVIAARGMLLSGLGPRAPGSAGVLLTDSAGNDGGLSGQTVFARGGPGAVSEALASAARAFGVDVRTGARVAQVRRNGDRVVGVTLDSGAEIDSGVVVSGLDPRTTLLKLIDPEALGPRLSWRATNIRQRGKTAKMNFALRALPVFPGAMDDARKLRGRIVLAPSMTALDEAARPAKYGELADEPLIEATIPTLADPALLDESRAGAVHHVLSAIVEGVPFAADAAALGDTVTKLIDTYAPGFAELVEQRQVVTPADIERDYGAAGGHAMHSEVSLDQWFEWRPLHGYGRYRMPLHGMYLCGSGAHPGGGITGAPGQLAAQEIVADLRGQRP